MRPRARRATAGVLLLLVLAAVTVRWTIRDAGWALVVSKDVGTPDAIVMLASHEWERIPAAAEMARRFPASVVLLTIPAQVTRFNCHLCGDRPAWLQREGIAANRIIQLPPNPAAGTYGEARAVSEYLTSHPLHRLLVVTSPYHTRRALHLFEYVLRGAGVEVGVRPASAYSIADPSRWWRHAYDRWYVRYEWGAILYYRLEYGVPLK
jgi:uncharacterized SAM-binding protein YcdF (DUF218 family)